MVGLIDVLDKFFSSFDEKNYDADKFDSILNAETIRIAKFDFGSVEWASMLLFDDVCHATLDDKEVERINGYISKLTSLQQHDSYKTKPIDLRSLRIGLYVTKLQSALEAFQVVTHCNPHSEDKSQIEKPKSPATSIIRSTEVSFAVQKEMPPISTNTTKKIHSQVRENKITQDKTTGTGFFKDTKTTDATVSPEDRRCVEADIKLKIFTKTMPQFMQAIGRCTDTKLLAIIQREFEQMLTQLNSSDSIQQNIVLHQT